MQSDVKLNWNVYVRGDYNSSLHFVQTAVKLKRINPDIAGQSSRKRRITRIGTHVFSLGRMIFARREFRVRMFF